MPGNVQSVGLFQGASKIQIGPGRIGTEQHIGTLDPLDQHLRLTLDNALKRMLMFAGKGGHLRLCLSYFFLVSPALGNSFIMNAEHETPRAFDIHVEVLFDSVYDKSIGV